MDRMNLLLVLFVLTLIVDYIHSDPACDCISLMDEQAFIRTKVNQIEVDSFKVKSRLKRLEVTRWHSTRPQKTSEDSDRQITPYDAGKEARDKARMDSLEAKMSGVESLLKINVVEDTDVQQGSVQSHVLDDIETKLSSMSDQIKAATEKNDENKAVLGNVVRKTLLAEKRIRINFESVIEKSMKATFTQCKKESEDLIRNHSNTVNKNLEKSVVISNEVQATINKAIHEEILVMNSSLRDIIIDLSETKTGLSNIANINKTINEEILSMNVSLRDVMKDLSETKTGLSNIANINKTINEEIQSMNVSLRDVMNDLSETKTGLSNIANINKTITEEIQSMNLSLRDVMKDLSETKTGLSNIADINKTINEEIHSMNESLSDVMKDLSETKTRLSNMEDVTTNSKKDCTCEDNSICIRQDLEKKCIPGQECEQNICHNGGTCVKTGMTETCYCLKGFGGKDCSQSEGEVSYNIRFIKAPISRTIKRGASHTEECQVEIPHGDRVQYYWSFNGSLIQPFSGKGFGSHPGGLLQIDNFTDGMEGQYSCIATTFAGTAEHRFKYRLVEDCDVRIFPGPQSESKKINEMALFSCHVDHRAKEVRWKKDGVYIDYKDARIRKLSNNYLQISNIEVSDAGIYRCEAEDQNGCYSYKEGKLQVVNLRPLNRYCGVSVHDVIKVSPRILKGSKALPNMNPWHVTIRSRGAAKIYATVCGGTLISQRFVLTAATCIDGFHNKFGTAFVAENVELLLGTTDCTGTGNDGIRRTVRRFVIHPNYRGGIDYDNDIALIELDAPCGYSDSVRPICVEPADYNDQVFLENSGSFSPVTGKVAGCGVVKGRSRLATNLQEIHLPFVYREQCMDSLGKYRHWLTDSMFCAGRNIGRTGDTCLGDRGGGLIMATSTRWVLTGIVSWGKGCDVDKYYGIYTNVGMFYDWIEQITKFSEEEAPDFMKHN